MIQEKTAFLRIATVVALTIAMLAAVACEPINQEPRTDPASNTATPRPLIVESTKQSSDLMSLSIATVLAVIVYGAIQAWKGIVEVWRGRSKGRLKVIFAIWDTPDDGPMKNINPYPSGLVIVQNQGPFEEHIQAMNYSVEGKSTVGVMCYRQPFRRASEAIAERPWSQQHFEKLAEERREHAKAKAYAFLSISETAAEDWRRKDDALREDIQNAYEAIKKQRKELGEDKVVINYPLVIPAGSSKRVDFDIPERWENHLDAITCLTVETTKEIVHVKRAYPEPSLPCTKCTTQHHRH